MRKILFCLAVACAAAPAAAQSVRAGIDRWEQGDATAAVATWYPLAEAGNPDAAFNLAQAYRLGRGVAQSNDNARSWFERAANAGHIKAQSSLGLLLFQNDNQQAALPWLSKAATAGEPRALLMLGTMLFNGESYPQDRVKAYAYVSRAAAQGLAQAKTTLAQMDAAMTVADRTKGVSMAQTLAARTKTVEIAEVEAPAPVTPRAKPIEIAELDAPAIAPVRPKTVRAAPPRPANVPDAELDYAPTALQAAFETSDEAQEEAGTPPPARVTKLVEKPKPKPRPKPVVEADELAPVRVAASGNWRIQLGAFGQRKSAETLYAKVSGKLPGRRAFYIPVGAVTRLQVGPFESRSAATAACSRLAPQACFAAEAK